MANKSRSAGILGIRGEGQALEFFLVHPGGPFFAKKDEGVWGVPKGLLDEGEDPLVCAKRELVEETGFTPPDGPYLPLGTVVQKSGKVVEAWAVRADFDAKALVSNTFSLQWPPGSGRIQRYPEVDRGAWLAREMAWRKIIPAQREFLDRARELFGAD